MSISLPEGRRQGTLPFPRFYLPHQVRRLPVHVIKAFDQAKTGGAERDRTDDLKLAKLALSQLSYSPNQTRHPP